MLELLDKPKSVKTITFGCKVNQADTTWMEQKLHHATGAGVNDSSESPEVVLINTCTVTASADQQARQMIRKMHRKYPDAKIVVTGCYTESKPELLKSIEGVSVVLPLAGQASIDRLFKGGEAALIQKPLKKRKTRLNFKLQDGCNAYCSFCILPYIRGRSRSIAPDVLLSQLRDVAEDYLEIVLTGTHIGAYGRDLEPRETLSTMIQMMLSRTQALSFRVSSLEPTGLTKEFIRLVGSEARIKPHFHIPLQSGSASVLKRMNRKYSPKNYADRVLALSKTRDKVAIGADVIVGFPGETEEEFQETVALIKNSPITYLHVFPYSPRPGTKSDKMLDDVSPLVKQARVTLLRELGDQKKLTFFESFLGSVQSVIIEMKKDEHQRLTGYTAHYIPIRVHGHDRLMRQEVDVKLIKIDKDSKGEVFVLAEMV